MSAAGESPSSAAAIQSGRLILLGAFVSAVAIGFRSQAAWLTLPLLVLAIADRGRARGRRRARRQSRLAGRGHAAVVRPAGHRERRPGRVLAALRAQAGEDWTRRRPAGHRLSAPKAGLRALRHLHPSLGRRRVVHRAARRRSGPPCCSGAAAAPCWPSSSRSCRTRIFHLLFQETVTTRYALPLVPAMAYLAVRGFCAPAPLGGLARRRGAGPRVRCHDGADDRGLFPRGRSPVSHALARHPSRGGGCGRRARRHASRVCAAGGGRWGWPARRRWRRRRSTSGWRTGEGMAGRRAGPVWFLADPRRTDLALVGSRRRGSIRGDIPLAVPEPGVSRRHPPERPALGRHQRAGMVRRGRVAPDAGDGRRGRADGDGLGTGPIRAWLRPRDGAATMIDRRAPPRSGSGPEAIVTVRIDGREIERWTVTPATPSFVKFMALPPGSSPAPRPGACSRSRPRRPTARTRGSSRSSSSICRPPARQCWASPKAGRSPSTRRCRALVALGQRKAVLRSSVTDRDVELQLVGESPRRYFDRPSRVVVTAGGHPTVERRCRRTTSRGRSACRRRRSRRLGGAITIETDQFFRPADRGQGADHRALGLRIYLVTLKPAS